MDSLMATAASPEDGGTSGASVAAMAEVKTISNTSALNYVVNSYIYHEAPDRMIVTCRGEKGGKPALWKVPGHRISKHAGVSVFDVSEPLSPKLVQRWDAPSRVEGQDRVGETLVVTNCDGILYTFDPNDISIGPRAQCKLSENGALHVRLYAHPGGKLFALVTSGFATKMGLPGGARALMAIDVTDPLHPHEVAKTNYNIPWSPEGIFVIDNRAYVGGVNDTKMSVYDLLGLAPLAVVPTHTPAIAWLATHSNRDYKQCVGQNTHPSNVASPYMYAALWTRPGGLGIFDVGDPNGSAPEVARLVTPELAMTNRVVLHHLYAILPLEDHPGGVAVVDVSDVTSPRLHARASFTGEKDTCYCACARNEYLYAFAAHGCSMHIFRVPQLALPRPLSHISAV